MYKYLTEQGKALQQQQYTPYTGDLVAPLNPIQQQGIEQVQQYAQSAQPYYQGAAAGTLGAMQGYTPQAFQQGVGGYFSPYLQNAMNATAAQLQNVNEQQRQKLLGNAIQTGAFGGDRGKIAQAALANQQNLAMGQTLGQMAQQGYSDAARNYLAGLQGQGAMASQLGNIGTTAQQQALAGAGAISQAGSVPYAIEQAKNAAAYQQFAQQQAYPYQTLGFLANIASGLGAGQGGTSVTTTPGPSGISQLLGGLTTIGSLMRFADGGAVEGREGHAHGGASSQGGLVPADGERKAFAAGGAYGVIPYEADPLYQLMAETSKVPVVSFIPDLQLRGGALDIKAAPEYTDEASEFMKGIQAMPDWQKSRLKGNLDSLLSDFGYGSNPNTSGMSRATQVELSGYGGMFAQGGLVPRSHHANGLAVDPAARVRAEESQNADRKDAQVPMTLAERIYGEPISEDARAGLLAAGLGMMASRSPFPGVAIGEGGMAGLNTYYNAIKNRFDIQKGLAELGLRGREVGVQEAGIPLRRSEVENAILQTKIKQFEDWRNLYAPIYAPNGRDIDSWSDPNGNRISPTEFSQRQINFMRNVGLPIDAYLGVQQQRASGGRTGYQQAGAVPSPTEEEDLPPDLVQMIELEKKINELQQNVPYWVKNPTQQQSGYKTVEDLRNQLMRMQERKYQTETGMEYQLRKDAKPSVNPPPEPFSETTPKAALDPNTGLIKTAPVNIGYPATKGYPTTQLPKYGVKVGADPVYAEAVKSSGPMETEFLEQSQNTQEAMLSLAKFAAAAKALETGALTGDKVKIAAVMRSLGFDQAATAVAGAKDVAEAQKLAKTAIDTAVSKVSSAFARPTQAEFQLMAAQAAPNLELMPDANFSLTSTQLGAAMWQDALRRDWLAAKAQGVQNFQGYQAAWKRQNPRKVFEDAAQRMIGNYAGQELPSADKLVSGGVYVVPAVKKGEKIDGLKKALYEGGFTAGDIITIPKVEHYKDEQGKMQVKLESPVKVPEDQVYQRIMSQFNLGQ
jgi:hypothetical protein